MDAGANASPMTRQDRLRLLARWPGDAAAVENISHSALLARLLRALIAERRRAIQGHWSYDPVRHNNLVKAIKDEKRYGTRARVSSHRRGGTAKQG